MINVKSLFNDMEKKQRNIINRKENDKNMCHENI